MKRKIKRIKQTNWFGFSGDFYLPIIIISIFFVIAGVALVTITSMMDFEKSLMSTSIWAGMCLLCVSTSFLIYMSYGPESEMGVFWRIIFPVIAFGILTALYFIFREHLFATYQRYEGDQDTIHIAIVSNIIAAGIINICFMLFRFFDVEEKHYIILMLISIGIAFLSMVIGNFVKLFWAAIIEFVANTISMFIICKVVGFMSPGNYQGDGSPYVGEKYETEDGHTLESKGGGEFVDENGDTWHSVGGDYVEKD